MQALFYMCLVLYVYMYIALKQKNQKNEHVYRTKSIQHIRYLMKLEIHGCSTHHCCPASLHRRSTTTSRFVKLKSKQSESLVHNAIVQTQITRTQHESCVLFRPRKHAIHLYVIIQCPALNVQLFIFM